MCKFGLSRMAGNCDFILYLFAAYLYQNKMKEAVTFIAPYGSQFRERAKNDPSFIEPFASMVYDLASVAVRMDLKIPAKMLLNLVKDNDALYARISKFDSTAIMSEEGFFKKVRDTHENIREKKAELPFFARNAPTDLDAFLEKQKNKKVLSVTRARAYSSKRSRPSEIILYLKQITVDAGLIPISFTSNSLVLPYSSETSEIGQELDRLEKTIAQEKPEFVFFEQFLDARREEKITLLKLRLSEMRDKYDFKLIGFFVDAWQQAHHRGFYECLDICDAVQHHSEELQAEPEVKNNPKVVFYNLPFSEAHFNCDYEAKEEEVSPYYRGTVQLPRVPWLQLIQQHNVPCTIDIPSHSDDDDLSDYMSYVRFIQKKKVFLNIASRNRTQFALTGRVWESVYSKIVVLEEDNDITRHFFIPFAHFIPYRNVGELKKYAEYLVAHPEIVREIAEETYDFALSYYPGKRVFYEYTKPFHDAL